MRKPVRLVRFVYLLHEELHEKAVKLRAKWLRASNQLEVAYNAEFYANRLRSARFGFGFTFFATGRPCNEPKKRDLLHGLLHGASAKANE